MAILINPPADYSPPIKGVTNEKTSELPTSNGILNSVHSGAAPNLPSTACPFLSGISHSPEDPIAAKPIEEFANILQNNKVLASTGCTPQFCQAGRATHIDEPRNGENRPLETIKAEASGFLWEMWKDGVYTEDQYNHRLEEVLQKLDADAVQGTVWINGKKTPGITATWTQNSEELLHGLRLAWKNSRKCIMRSHYLELRLCDLRHVKTSAGMIAAVIEHTEKAYNDGKIQPTGATEPHYEKRNFVAYLQPDGTILGDPSNVELTTDIMALGWKPPQPKTQWDILPLVAMAENDAPALGELPEKLRELIDIRHPQYETAFESLGLKWYRFPALSRLGFDIGGVQYTAAPFVGWYMDAEIGVRNLADGSRYDALFRVAQAIGLDMESYRQREEYKEVESLEDLPDHEQLLWMSRAQNELNYAVRYSFIVAGVSCSGTLAASNDYCRFDEEHVRVHGYRLNADPYWLAPPQGSIVPIWHRGGAPNYQPKPMITRHRFDPVKTWVRGGRKRGTWVSIGEGGAIVSAAFGKSYRACSDVFQVCKELAAPSMVSRTGMTVPKALSMSVNPNIYIHYCSTGTTAVTLAEKLHQRVQKQLKIPCTIGNLNTLQIPSLPRNSTLLLLVSTTGTGDIPANGKSFSAQLDTLREKYSKGNNLSHINVAIFGVGDVGYAATFNGAAKIIESFWKDVGAKFVKGGVVMTDVSVEAMPLSAFNRWWRNLKATLSGDVSADTAPEMESPEDAFAAQSRMLQTFRKSMLLSKYSSHMENDRIATITLDLLGATYRPMSHLRILPTNHPSKVNRTLHMLGIADGQQPVPFATKGLQPSWSEFLREFVDLEGEFKELTWLERGGFHIKRRADATNGQPEREGGGGYPVFDMLERLTELKGGEAVATSDALRLDICLAMPLLRPRSFSVASAAPSSSSISTVDLLIKIHPHGRFSSTFLSKHTPASALLISPIPSFPGQPLLSLHNKPILAVATGSGVAPLQSLLQYRLHATRAANIAGERSPFADSQITLIVGLKKGDCWIVRDVIGGEAMALGLVEALVVVPSNGGKLRVQDCLIGAGGEESLRERMREGWAYVCGSKAMVRGVCERLSAIMNEDVVEAMGKRYIQEVF
ncbi:hypothetical protein FGG08_000549 [Glutinoglossum americanum]|uniref:nitric-oxide synthase (NADPH) n=1 Tax=Glutinoglossum americanum TaxID=1670608 RepID=A0A9P8II27_9PEZI|nr:hypothetical protein FGG08_000549 [Glutinoglossum americanum]